MLELLKCSLEPGYINSCESKGLIISHLGGVHIVTRCGDLVPANFYFLDSP